MSRRLRASVSGSELFPKMRPRKRSSTLETVVEAFHLPTISSLNQPLDRSRYGLCVGSLGKTITAAFNTTEQSSGFIVNFFAHTNLEFCIKFNFNVVITRGW